MLLVALVPPKLFVDELKAVGVFSLLFDESFVALENGEADEKPVFRTSFWLGRNRSRKSQADVCFTSVGRATADNFLAVLKVARTGLIGVTLDGVEHFALEEPVGFTFFTFGVYLEDILYKSVFEHQF